MTQLKLNQNNLLTFSILISRRTSDLATDASLIEPQSLAFAPNGDLYIAESDSQRINRYALTNPQGRRNFLSIQPKSSSFHYSILKGKSFGIKIFHKLRGQLMVSPGALQALLFRRLFIPNLESLVLLRGCKL